MLPRDQSGAILAVDIGTSELKGALITAEGRVVASARAGYPIDLDPDTGRAEQNPQDWWAALSTVAAQLTGHGVDAAEPIVAISCVGQGPTLVAVDASGHAIRPAVTWLDNRGSALLPDLERATAQSGWSLGILPAARWLEVNQPQDAARTRWYLNSWEWATLRLTGVAARTQVPGQSLVDPARADAGGVSRERLPPVVLAGQVVGRLDATAAGELGLAAGIPVHAGTVDSFASFHGAGLLEQGDAVDTGGTSGGLAVYANQAMEIPGTWTAPAPLPGRWFVGGAMTATGKALDWLAGDVLGARSLTRTLVDEAAAISPGAHGLLFLPYLAGERSPIWDPGARGAFVGLTLGHQQGHLVRAVLEAAAFALRHVATPILDAGLPIRELRVTGGTASYDAWNQIKADVLSVPVVVPEVLDAALMGAAILAAPAAGWHADTAAAIRSMVRAGARHEPTAANRHAYDASFESYVALWPAIAPTTHRLGEIASGAARRGA